MSLLNNINIDEIVVQQPCDYPKKHMAESIIRDNVDELIKELNLRDGMTLSFHHHLRNGDRVLMRIMEAVSRLGIKDLTIAASSIFPAQEGLIPMIEDGTIKNIITSYISGPVGEAISRGALKGHILMQSHGGRARSILEGEIAIDAAFIGAPSSDEHGNVSGVNGENTCGSLGYAIADSMMAKKVVVVTDCIMPYPNYPADITEDRVDYVLKVDSIGLKSGIVSGTTKITKDPVGLKIAKDTLNAMKGTGLLKDGFSFQTGAGGISLAVADFLRDYMRENSIKGSFASGGITGYLVKMLEEDLFENLFDVQCFDLEAVESISKNPKHLRMSGSQYGNPHVNNVVNNLDIVILGATEIDKNFNVNVTTGSHGMLMGGSGGHQDTAFGAKVSIIVSKLLSSRIPFIKDRVDVITTPGNTVDILVTERGIAINPLREDLIKSFDEAGIAHVTIDELKSLQESFIGCAKTIEKTERVIGFSQSRDGSILDLIYQVK